MNKALHPWHDVDRQYQAKKEGERGFACIQDIDDTSIQRLEDYIKGAEEDWLHQQKTI